jgi:hypothetical protein
LHGAAVVRFGKQQSGNEGAKCHREPSCRRHEAGADRNEHCGGDEEVVVTRLCDETEQRLKQKASNADDNQ